MRLDTYAYAARHAWQDSIGEDKALLLAALDEVFTEEVGALVNAWDPSWPMAELVLKLDEFKRLARAMLNRDERQEPRDDGWIDACRTLGRAFSARRA